MGENRITRKLKPPHKGAWFQPKGVFMKVRDNNIIIEDISIRFGMSFETINNRLQLYIYTEFQPDNNGNGHIILKKQLFYGFKGSSTLYFQDSKLAYIGFAIDWSMYNFSDNSGKMLPIDEAVARIKQECENELGYCFEIEDNSTYENKAYRKDSIIVYSTISRNGDNYSLLVQLGENKNAY